MVAAEVEGGGTRTKFRLASDVRVIPETEFPEEARDSLGRDQGRFVVFRPGARTGPLLVDGKIAALLAEFEQPSAIVESLIRFSARRQLDPQEMLRETFPVLEVLVERRFLVNEDSHRTDEPESRTLGPGDHIGDLLVVRRVQRMEDTEVFQVRSADSRICALKIESRESSPAAEWLAHEAEVLRLLAGDPSPELIATGEHERRQYLVLEWRPGSGVLVATEELRQQGGSGARPRLRDICCRFLTAFGRLHRRGVVHGDINARNILVDRRGRVTLLDFETAAPVDSSCGLDPPRSRAGVPIYQEPELARAEINGEPFPAATLLGEQYSLAALAYQILTGETYLDFDLRRDRLLTQIIEQAPASFADQGAPPWPAVEEVLARALSKAPDRRFSSVDEMAAALAEAEPSEPARRRRTASTTSHLDEVVSQTVEAAAKDGKWAAEAADPGSDSSVYLGAAGVAAALAQISRATALPALLDTADWWIRRAVDGLARWERDEEQTNASTLVGSAGVHLVEAMIAAALDQPDREERALRQSLRCLASVPRGLDLYDGRSGRLLTSSLLADQVDRDSVIDLAEVATLGQEAVGILWSDLERRPPVADTIGDLGMAHGWAGYLFSTLRWVRLTGDPPPVELERRLRELADESVPVGRGLMWPWRLPLGCSDGPQFTAGWCNGSAGHVFLWTEAANVLGEEPWLELARGAAWNAWESAQRDGSLCCGLAGRAFALLHLARETGEEVWIDRARHLAGIALDRGAFKDEHPWGLFQGRLGLALLAAELRNPDTASFPFIT